jgi:hypothetical protein
MPQNEVQSISISKNKFTLPEVINWLLSHKYKHNKVDINPNNYKR